MLSNRFFGVLITFLQIATILAAQTSGKNELELGIQAYREAKYELAMSHFRNAAALDPQNQQAHLYLANALAQQYVPGVDLPENKRIGGDAIAEYGKLLEINPQSRESIKGIANLLLQMKKFQDSKSYYRKGIESDPNDSELYFSIGVIDWTQAYGPRMKLRAKLRMRPDEQLSVDFPGCWELRDSNLGAVQEGMEMFTKAIELRPDYDDAMAYMNLLYRERAEIQCNNPEGRAADLQAADNWVDLTMAAKKRKMEVQKRKAASVE